MLSYHSQVNIVPEEILKFNDWSNFFNDNLYEWTQIELSMGHTVHN